MAKYLEKILEVQRKNHFEVVEVKPTVQTDGYYMKLVMMKGRSVEDWYPLSKYEYEEYHRSMRR